MKTIGISLVLLFLFFACANIETAKTSSYIGVDVPDFKNHAIDSLVQLYEADRALFYQAQERKSMQEYYRRKAADKGGYNITGFYDEVINILNTDSDKDELLKFRNYITESTAKSKVFMDSIK